jgi:hypothetical protein
LKRTGHMMFEAKKMMIENVSCYERLAYMLSYLNMYVLFVKLIISVRSCTYIFVKVNVDASIMVR